MSSPGHLAGRWLAHSVLDVPWLECTEEIRDFRDLCSHCSTTAFCAERVQGPSPERTVWKVLTPYIHSSPPNTFPMELTCPFLVFNGKMSSPLNWQIWNMLLCFSHVTMYVVDHPVKRHLAWDKLILPHTLETLPSFSNNVRAMPRGSLPTCEWC